MWARTSKHDHKMKDKRKGRGETSRSWTTLRLWARTSKRSLKIKDERMGKGEGALDIEDKGNPGI